MTPTPRAPGRPSDPAIDAELLRAAQDLLIEEGFDRLTMDAVARRCGASKATIYRRWPSKTALVVAAAAALFVPPEGAIPKRVCWNTTSGPVGRKLA